MGIIITMGSMSSQGSLRLRQLSPGITWHAFGCRIIVLRSLRRLILNGRPGLLPRTGVMLPRKVKLMEEEMQELNRATSTRMFWFSFLSLFVCLSVAGLQFWGLKTFFERKKLL